MGYREEYEAKMKKVRAEVDDLTARNPKPVLDKRFLKAFGCVNFRSEEFLHELDLAREYHRRMKDAYPEDHEVREYEPRRCYHEIKCKCGFSEACDSSD